MESAQDLTKPIITKALGNPEPCERHGPKSSTKFDALGEERVHYFCEACRKEKADAESAWKAQRDAREMQEKLNQRIDNAMISPRFKDKRLENWIAQTDAQKKVLQSARRFIETRSNSTGLIFMGRPGTGKNHLACGIVQEVLRTSPETALITSAMKIFRSIKESWKKDGITESQVLESFWEVDLLVIDEIGVQFGSETEWIYITEIINDRYEWLKPTILISNLNMPQLTELLGERVIDRFREGGHIVVFDWESRRGK